MRGWDLGTTHHGMSAGCHHHDPAPHSALSPRATVDIGQRSPVRQPAVAQVVSNATPALPSRFTLAGLFTFDGAVGGPWTHHLTTPNSSPTERQLAHLQSGWLRQAPIHHSSHNLHFKTFRLQYPMLLTRLLSSTCSPGRSVVHIPMFPPDIIKVRDDDRGLKPAATFLTRWKRSSQGWENGAFFATWAFEAGRNFNDPTIRRASVWLLSLRRRLAPSGLRSKFPGRQMWQASFQRFCFPLWLFGDNLPQPPHSPLANILPLEHRHTHTSPICLPRGLQWFPPLRSSGRQRPERSSRHGQ
ncbi:hypothetical protein B0T16DRAFT_94561 [Cercophora newfieldiana]|uniref:Uncharacterized protein n=1 Tax=Cercophora newfieldiana TaxID=92897 RepID=A0AA39YIG4_9PEZI|nr:hypothetical protein B0T16DRAFT_94561 [Cercophora newfieldiana]